MSQLYGRHIQDFSNVSASQLQHHWGFSDRIVPCTVDHGSCEYLDLVYGAHDRGLIYTAVIWATIIAVLGVWGLARIIAAKNAGRSSPDHAEDPTGPPPRSAPSRLARTVAATARHYLLPEVGLRRLVGRVTRFQVVVLAALTGYLVVWIFLGMTYRRWVTPVKKLPGVYSTRTSLGPFADRLGVLAFALMPLSILLSSRESVLSLITGVPYHHFTFLHRWLGHVIFVQAGVHAMGWCIIEGRLYQPQPRVGREWIGQNYVIWGVVALALLTLLWVLSLPVSVRAFGYEFFRKTHYVLAMVFLGACWAHWAKLKVFLLPALILWAIDRALRLVRSALLHYRCVPNSLGGLRGFQPAPARITSFPDERNGDVVRLDFALVQQRRRRQPWSIGQHFFLCFTEGSIWQSHPLTPLSDPSRHHDGDDDDGDTVVQHSYLFRAKSGETKRIAELASSRCAEPTSEARADGGGKEEAKPTTGVILTGPYGASIMEHVDDSTNVLCLAGGTGITFVLPILLRLAAEGPSHHPGRALELCWVVRRAADAEWIRPELDALSAHKEVNVRLYVTREGDAAGFLHGDQDGCGSPSETKEAASAGGPMETTPASQAGSLASRADVTGADGHDVPGRPVLRSSAAGSGSRRRPDVDALIRGFVRGRAGPGDTTVFVSGPGEMVTDARKAVAGCNPARPSLCSGRGSVVRLIDDNRLEF